MIVWCSLPRLGLRKRKPKIVGTTLNCAIPFYETAIVYPAVQARGVEDIVNLREDKCA